MVCRRILSVLSLVLLASTLWAQEAYRTNVTPSGGLTATGSVTVNVRGMGTAAVQLVNTGSPSGTVSFEGRANTDWAAVLCTPPGTTTAVTTTTAAGLWTCAVAGLSDFRARVSTYTSGNFHITVAATVGGGASGGGGGALAGDASATKQDEQTTLLTALDGHVDGLEGSVDGLETVLGATGDAGSSGAVSINAHLRFIAATGIPITGTVAVTQSGTWDEIGINDSGNSITVDGLVTANPGTAANWGIFPEDSAHSSTQAGIQVFGVRQDSQADFAADGDYVPLSIDADGQLRVAFSGAAGGTSLADDGDISAGTTPGTPSMGFYQSSVTACTDGDSCIAGMTAQRAWKVMLVNNAGTELTSGDATVGTAGVANGPQVQLVYKDFDGSALPTTTNVNTEEEAVPPAASIVGVQYFMPTNEDGSKTVFVDEDVASAAADLLMKIACIRDDTLDARSTTEGDYEMCHLNASGALWVAGNGNFAITAASGSIGSGAIASGAVASGAIASGAVASGAFASGALASGSIASGAIADMLVDDAAFTPATSRAMPMGLQADETSPDSVDEGDIGVPRMSLDRLQYMRFLDPCSGVAKTHIPINIATATTTELTAALSGASVNWYVCGIDLVTAAANNVALTDDNSDNCASVTAGLAGGTTAATGWNFAANGGLVKGTGNSTVFKSVTSNSVLCLVTSAATQLSGSIQVVAAP